MSEASAIHEEAIGKNINKLIKEGFGPHAKAKKTSKGTKYSDVEMYIPVNQAKKPRLQLVWCEVKMNHTDNLSNTRVLYKNGEWQISEKSESVEVGKFTCDILNKSKQTKAFLKDLASFVKIPLKHIILPAAAAEIKQAGKRGYENVVGIKDMVRYFANKKKLNADATQYIVNEPGHPIGDLVTIHYNRGKLEPVYYMQSGDDFYKIGNTNPLGLKGIPLFRGEGNFKVRISLRPNKDKYEIQPEMKVQPNSLPRSPFSCKPRTSKKNPFATV